MEREEEGQNGTRTDHCLSADIRLKDVLSLCTATQFQSFSASSFSFLTGSLVRVSLPGAGRFVEEFVMAASFQAAPRSPDESQLDQTQQLEEPHARAVVDESSPFTNEDGIQLWGRLVPVVGGA